MKTDQLLCSDCLSTNQFPNVDFTFVYRTKYFYTFCSVSVVVSLSETFLLISFLTSPRIDVFIHAVCKSASLLKTFTTLHCVFNNREHIFLASKQPFFGGGFYIWQSPVEFCEAGSLLAYKKRTSKSAKLGFRIMRMCVLNNCDEGQPSCAILQYMYNY